LESPHDDDETKGSAQSFVQDYIEARKASGSERPYGRPEGSNRYGAALKFGFSKRVRVHQETLEKELMNKLPALF
jgi:hypothetical protein